MPNLPTHGNAVAGMLADVFVPEMTTAVTTCANCGSTAPIGELVSYSQAPGVVLRCRICGAPQLRMVKSKDRVWLDLRGALAVEITL